MTLNLIGTGLNEKSITLEALEAIKKSKKVYLENYTVDFPYPKTKLEKVIKRKITELTREQVESLEFLKEATSVSLLKNKRANDKNKKSTNAKREPKQDISLLVYGDSLSATTHSEIILTCKNNEIPFKIFHNASVMTAIAETGLQLYKFGKTASMPTWKNNWKPDSFMEIVKQNQSIQAHTLLLVDIALDLEKAKQQLKEAMKNHNLEIEQIVLCSNLGNEATIIYDKIENLPKEITKPYCFIIPSRLHFHEQEFLDKCHPQ
ncbi:Diphthine synthase [uncultured archaeon]|nr:Diphthine synthase [uncultured archaeon]